MGRVPRRTRSGDGMDSFSKQTDLNSETFGEDSEPEMITVANRLYVKSEYADAFEKVFRARRPNILCKTVDCRLRRFGLPSTIL